jgi:tetratricopeptide (TPR) repeat protein
MELLLFLIPSFLHGLITGKISLTKTEEEIQTKKFKLGIDLYNAGKIDKAFLYLSSKKLAFPKSAYLHLYLGKCHYYFENYAAALESFDLSLRFDSTILEVYELKGNCHYFLEEWEHAYFHLKKADRFFKNKNLEVINKLKELEFRTQKEYS